MRNSNQFRNYLVVISVLLNFESAYSQSFHNINGFYGERAAGLGGAFTAVSDDPSGAYYNPAGLAFIATDSISISASNYKVINKKYRNVDSPGEDYSQNSTTFLPNFMGIVKTAGKWRIGFSIVNTLDLNFSRNDQISLPVFSTSINNTKIYNTERYNQVQIGPSLAYSITDKFSIGATIYYTEDNQGVQRSLLQQYSDYSYVSRSYVDNRRTTGALPVIGVQFQPIDKLSLGFSVKQQIVSKGNRLYNEYYLDSLKTKSAYNVDFIEGTHKNFSSVESGNVYIKPSLNSAIPANRELRIGAAFFASKFLMASFDIIHTTGYSKNKNQTEVSFGSSKRVILNDTEIQELSRKPTTNYALGVESYLTDNFSILAGVFTNYSNTKEIKWADSAVQLALKSSYGSYSMINQDPFSILVKFPNQRFDPRNEHSNNLGFSFGMSWSTSKASISITLIKETGKGASRIDANSFSQPFIYDSTSFYLVVSSKN